MWTESYFLGWVIIKHIKQLGVSQISIFVLYLIIDEKRLFIKKLIIIKKFT